MTLGIIFSCSIEITDSKKCVFNILTKKYNNQVKKTNGKLKKFAIKGKGQIFLLYKELNIEKKKPYLRKMGKR